MYELIYYYFNVFYLTFLIPSLIALTWKLQKFLEGCMVEGETKWG